MAYMPDPASGLAMAEQLLYSGQAYAASGTKTVSQIASMWSGGGRNQVAGYDPNQVVTQAWLDAGNMQPFVQSFMQGETSRRQQYSPADWNAAAAYYALGSAPGNTVGGTMVSEPPSQYSRIMRPGGQGLQGGFQVGTPGAWVGPPGAPVIRGPAIPPQYYTP